MTGNAPRVASTSLTPEPTPRSAAFVFTSTFIFSVGTVAAYLFLVSSVKGAAVFVLTYDSADEWGWGETLVLVPWTAVGTILIDGYHVPRIRRSLGLL